jgi:hypothetical protein
MAYKFLTFVSIFSGVILTSFAIAEAQQPYSFVCLLSGALLISIGVILNAPPSQE